VKLYHIALNNLRRRRGKMAFLVAGLLIGIATIVTLLAITDRMSQDIEERLDQFGANIVMVPRNDNLTLTYGGITVGGVSYETSELEEAKIPQIRMIDNARNLGLVVPKVLGRGLVDERPVLLMGTDLEAELALKNWWQFTGRPPAARDEVIIGSEVAALFHLGVEDPVTISGALFTVSTILAPTGAAEDAIIIGDLHALQQLLGKGGKISLVEIAAFCRDCPITELVLQIAERFPEAKVTALKQAVMAKMQSIELFRSFSYGVAFLVVIIGALLVFVTMMGSVSERTREIGIFRAIGFRQTHIMQIILLEAIVVGLIGGIFGVLGGNTAAWAILPLVIPDGSLTAVNWSLAAVAVLLSVSLSVLASLYPARRASRLDPSMALRVL